MAKQRFAVKSPYRALALAATLPVFPLMLIDPSIGIIMVIVGLPISLISMLVIGAPVYLLLKKAKLLSFPFCIIGGLMCTAPANIMFFKATMPLEFSLSQIVSFSVLGMLGGLIFWLAYARAHIKEKSKPGMVLGYLILLPVAGSLLHANQYKKIAYIDGETTSSNQPFVSDIERNVPVLIDGVTMSARLAAFIPYRKDCAVTLSKWRDLFTDETRYSISIYPDSPFAHHFEALNEETKQKIKDQCHEGDEVQFFSSPYRRKSGSSD